MQLITVFVLLFLFIALPPAEARIRNRKVKEAPKACKVMSEDTMLSRDGKKVLGTLRHSLLIENDDADSEPPITTISLVKDKGEKICPWTEEQWNGILVNNKIEDVGSFNFFVDEYKEMLYPFAKKSDNSYLLMTIPFQSCEFVSQVTKEKLELPKCEIPKKKKRKRSKKSSFAKK